MFVRALKAFQTYMQSQKSYCCSIPAFVFMGTSKHPPSICCFQRSPTLGQTSRNLTWKLIIQLSQKCSLKEAALTPKTTCQKISKNGFTSSGLTNKAKKTALKKKKNCTSSTPAPWEIPTLPRSSPLLPWHRLVSAPGRCPDAPGSSRSTAGSRASRAPQPSPASEEDGHPDSHVVRSAQWVLWVLWGVKSVKTSLEKKTNKQTNKTSNSDAFVQIIANLLGSSWEVFKSFHVMLCLDHKNRLFMSSCYVLGEAPKPHCIQKKNLEGLTPPTMWDLLLLSSIIPKWYHLLLLLIHPCPHPPRWRQAPPTWSLLISGAPGCPQRCQQDDQKLNPPKDGAAGLIPNTPTRHFWIENPGKRRGNHR